MKQAGVYEPSQPDRIVFGQSAVLAIRDEVERQDKHRVAVFCSASLERASGIVQDLQSALGNRFAGAFTDIPAHTPRSAVLAGAAFARKLEANLLISLGGGSVIDGVKAIQLALSEGLETEEELFAFARNPNQPRPLRTAGPSLLRQIAVPTTLSGAEFSALGGVTDETTHTKEGYLAPDGIPTTVIFDPELCLHTPTPLWLSSAIRSIDHACEGYCSPDTFAFLDQQYLAALSLLSKALRQTKADPGNQEARLLAQQGVWTVSAGIGQVRNGASHGLGYILGAHGVPHGETSCVLLPAVLKWNEAINSERQRALSVALGRSDKTAAEAVRELVQDLGLPTRLSDVGIEKNQWQKIAELGTRHPTVLSNPRPVTSPQDILDILRLAS